MKKICIIPARMGSTRFPGKPVALALNTPVVIHVAKRCKLNSNLDDVVVATCDEEIMQTCAHHGIKAVMTSSKHERCTDRVSEAIDNLQFDLNSEDLVLMVQGDEILVTPDMLQTVINAYETTKAPAINLLSRIYEEDDHEDPNVVKVVASPKGRALYLSRAPIPSRYRAKDASSFQQTGVIGFSSQFLREFSALTQTPLEIIESIDMLRILEHHLELQVVYTDKETIAVDVPNDLIRAIKKLESDSLLKLYA